MKHGVTDEEIERAADLLRSGGLVAFPTETYYGLAVDPFNNQALERLFKVKNRPAVKPVLVLVAGIKQMDLLADQLPKAYYTLIERFWPGPLTLVCKAGEHCPGLLTGGLNTIGIRQSPNEIAGRLVRAFSGPITATSANLSGRKPASTARQVRETFGLAVDMILDGGKTPGRKGSTLVGVTSGELYCIREGEVPYRKIIEYLRQETS